MIRRRFLRSAAALAVTACAPSSTAVPASTALPSAAASGSPAAKLFPRYGVAGVIPRGFPAMTADTLRDLYRSVGETGGLLGVYANWTDASSKEAQVPAGIGGPIEASRQHGFTPLVLIGTEGLRPGDAAQRSRFVAVVERVAADARPAYLGIGNEMNLLRERHPDAFAASVEALPEARAAVKSASPETALFTVLQLELVIGRGYLITTRKTSPEQWDVLDALRPHVDVVAFTTYPFFDLMDPSEIPADRYDGAARKAGRPIAFTEVGWPSRPFSTAPASGHGGSPEEQAAFARRFLELTAPLEPRFSLWSFPHDVGTGAGPSFESLGLRENDGTPKPVLAVWSAARTR